MKKTKLVIQQAENGTYFTQVSKGVRPDGKRNRRMFTGSTEDEVYSRRQSGSRALRKRNEILTL